ncbi:peritrophin-1 [Ixodes scapularis]|uniref:peritrophin-1 n=1 Tax=Ixodes scapularis TaxID=6945 RepID=UPI001A9D51AA|nr:peritrophin-1 [Ixodes scapularis]
MKVALLLVACMMAMLPAVMAFAFVGAPAGWGSFLGDFQGGAKGGAPSADAAGAAPADSGGLPTEPSCPESDGFEPLYIADPDDCTKYKVCSGGFGMKLDCPPGLHFNKVTGKCDFPLHANCEEVTTQDPRTLKGAPGIKKDAYFDVDSLDGPGHPTVTGQPNPGIGQLSSDTGLGKPKP